MHDGKKHVAKFAEGQLIGGAGGDGGLGTSNGNQTGIDLQAAFDKKLELKTQRDHDRHQKNKKLK
mgnify:CR=1 FL=1